MVQDAREQVLDEGLSGSWCREHVHDCSEMISVIEAIVDRLSRAGYSRKETFGVRLALEEAIVNALKHGHRNDTSKAVQVRFCLDRDALLAEIEDQGPGFDPEAIPDPLLDDNLDKPSGRGLLLMRNYMTWVRYNATGTCVTLCKQKQAS